MKKKFFAALLTVPMISLGLFCNTSFAADTDYERENNNSFEQANVIVPDSSVQGNISDYDDVDYYAITAPANGKISLAFGHTIKASDSGWTIKVYSDESGTHTLSETSIQLNEDKSYALPYIGAVKGKTYYVEVTRGWNGDDVYGQTYTVRTSFQASEYYERETNDDFVEATQISPGKTVQGILSKYEDIDYYQITAPANGKIGLSFEHTVKASNSGWTIEVYSDESGTQTLSETSIQLNENKSYSLPYIGAVKGKRYYIVVSRKDWSGDDLYGQNYTVKTSFQSSNAYEKETNDDFTEATKITLGTAIQGNISKYADTDYYKITASSNGRIKLFFAHTVKASDSGWYIAVCPDESGTNYLSETYIEMRDGGTIELPAIGASKGKTYYIVVKRKDYSDDDLYGQNYKLTALIPRSISGATVTGIQAKTYTGKNQTQSLIVKIGKKTLKSGTNYSLTYRNNVNAGKASVIITGKGAYTGSITKYFTINKAANPMQVSGKTAKVRYNKQSAQKIAASKICKFAKKAAGTVRYKKVSGKKKILVAANGTITVKKGLKRGTYSLQLKVDAKGNGNYKSKSANITAKIVVK